MTRERFVVLVILTHLIAAALHGVAHATLAVPVGGAAGLLFIAGAVYVGPLAALAALLAGRGVAAGAVLSTSMGAALLYGLAFHFVLPTPDHISAVPIAPWGWVFQFTAVAIAALEACGLAGGLLLMHHAKTT